MYQTIRYRENSKIAIFAHERSEVNRKISKGTSTGQAHQIKLNLASSFLVKTLTMNIFCACATVEVDQTR